MHSLTRSFLLAGGFVMALGAVPASAGQVNFDDLPGNGAAVPSNYAGFTWGPNWEVYDQGNYNSSYGNTATFPSFPNVAYNGFGVTEVDLFASTPTVFNDAEFSTWADNNENVGFSSSSVTVQGWNGATLEWTVSEDLGPNFTDLAFGAAPVDQLKFLNDGSGGQWWLVDNINFGPSSAVPEPITLSLFGAGLAGAAAMRRRKKKVQAG
jgi:hypothetical protein